MVALKWTDFPEAQMVPDGAGRPLGTTPCRTAPEHPAGRGLLPAGVPVSARVSPQAVPRRTSRPTAGATRRRRVFFWRRVIAVVAIAGIGVAVWVAGGRLMAVAGAEPTHAAFEPVYITKPGDTIWGIAVRFSGDSDPRPLAYKLEAQIGGGVLQPGDQLTIP